MGSVELRRVSVPLLMTGIIGPCVVKSPVASRRRPFFVLGGGFCPTLAFSND